MSEVQTRESNDSNDLYVEGYFAVFGDIYKVWDGATESIAPGAFKESVNGDVRALFNHNHDLILGRTSAGTLTLDEDEHGLHGIIKINRNDQDAMNAYARIQRGDVTGCSFGFDIKRESQEVRADGSIHWTIEEVDPLYEVSPCVFPAYEATSVSSRGKEIEEIRKRKLEVWKHTMLNRLKGDSNGTESTDAEKED